jgi:ubiquinone/menaquinone biosynthesis C-methylase UbiE
VTELDAWAEWLVRTRFAGWPDDEVRRAHGELERTRDRVLDGARIEAGERVLDVGAGTGLLTLGAVGRVGPDGDVLAVDPSVDCLEELRRESSAPNVAYLVGDAEVLPLPDSYVDVALTRSVLIYVDALERAARELFRVVRAGGCISLFEPLNRRGTYAVDAVDWSPLGELGERVRRDEREFLERRDPLSRLDADELAALLGAAGFADVDPVVEETDEPWEVTEESVDLRLDAVAAPGHPSRRERWGERYAPAEVERLVGHMKALAGTTVELRWVSLWLTARKP